MRAVANMRVTQWGTLVAHTATFSPFRTPIARLAAARAVVLGRKINC